MEISFLQPIFLILMAVSCVMHSMHAPMLLAEVAMILGASFLGNLACRLGTRPLVSILTLVRSLLVGLCIGSFSG